MHQYREITTKSWGQRIAGSFGGAIIGLIFFIASFPLIWWNEGRSVDRIKTLDEGKSIVVSISSEYSDKNNNNKLVHIFGTANSEETLRDNVFGIDSTALKLRRTVEMYQWKEHKRTQTKTNLGGSETTETIYSYDKTWSEELISSGNFKMASNHINPSSMPYKSKIFVGSHITIGAFKLTDSFVNQIDNFEDLPVLTEHHESMNPQLKQHFKPYGSGYFSGNPALPEIGSIRIRYSIAPPVETSVIGKQSDNSITSYNTKNGTISLLDYGNIDAESMFVSAAKENSITTWLIRIGAFVLMWIGLMMVLNPIRTIGDVLPIVGSILGAGIGLVTGVIAIVLSFITIAIAWIFFRPVIGVILLVTASIFAFGGIKTIRQKLKKKMQGTQLSNASYK